MVFTRYFILFTIITVVASTKGKIYISNFHDIVISFPNSEKMFSHKINFKPFKELLYGNLLIYEIPIVFHKYNL